MIRLWYLALVVMLVMMGCQQAHEARADDVRIHLDEVFTLAGGQDAMLAGEDLHVRFAKVLEDSRCPTEVECFWTGQARLAVDVHPAASPPATVSFNTNPAPGLKVLTAQVDGYTIELASLDPYPRTPDDDIALEQYRAALIVRRGAPPESPPAPSTR